MSLTLLDTTNFESEIEQASIPVVIDVFATWCPPCKVMDPILEDLAKEFAGRYKFVKINVDQSRELAIKFGVTTIPTFLFFKDGQLKGRQTGAMTKDEFKKVISDHLG